MRVELRPGIWSDKVPHEKCKIERVTYYFAKMPIGDYAIHKYCNGDNPGYDGEYVEFLMVDGTVETVRGPYHCDGCYNYCDRDKLSEFLKRPEIAEEAHRLRIGTNLWTWITGGAPNVIYEEKEFTLGRWQDRFKPEWRKLMYELVTVKGSRFGSVKDYVW